MVDNCGWGGGGGVGGGRGGAGGGREGSFGRLVRKRPALDELRTHDTRPSQAVYHVCVCVVQVLTHTKTSICTSLSSCCLVERSLWRG